MSNVHATTIDGNNFPTKKAFKEAVATSPLDVTLTCYDFMGEYAGQAWRANELPENVLFIVPGPDPQTSRRWFANIRRDGDKIVVQ
jgi:hypothetical protein